MIGGWGLNLFYFIPIISRTTSPAISNPATDGTKDMLDGTGLPRCVFSKLSGVFTGCSSEYRTFNFFTFPKS